MIEGWLEEKAAADQQVQLLLTHKGVGLLSAIAVVHILGDVTRFASSKQAEPLLQGSIRWSDQVLGK